MQRVLELMDYRATSRRGEQLRGACPFHTSETSSPHCFSIHLSRGLFHCFRCGAHGNQLDLWSQVRGLSLHDAALDLGRRLSILALDRESESR